jgi:hypothetical protein
MINELVALAKERYAIERDLAARFSDIETGDVTNCETGTPREARVHINTGVEVLASECGATIASNLRGDDTYPWEHSFMYGGVLFFEITEGERLR